MVKKTAANLQKNPITQAPYPSSLVLPSIISHIPHQKVCRNLHFGEGEPFLAEIFQRCSNVINGVLQLLKVIAKCDNLISFTFS